MKKCDFCENGRFQRKWIRNTYKIQLLLLTFEPCGRKSRHFHENNNFFIKMPILGSLAPKILKTWKFANFRRIRAPCSKSKKSLGIMNGSEAPFHQKSSKPENSHIFAEFSKISTFGVKSGILMKFQEIAIFRKKDPVPKTWRTTNRDLRFRSPIREKMWNM